MSRILITGGAGFIGPHLARHLAANSCNEIVLADNLSRGRMDQDLTELLRNPKVTLERIDLVSPRPEFDRLGRSFDDIYHLAAVNGTQHFYSSPDTVLRTNILATIAVLDYAQTFTSPPRLLFTSSNEAYAGLEALDALPLPTPETVPLVVADPYNARWSYGASKLAGEMLVIHSGLPAMIVRPHNFYGERAGFEHVVPQLILRAARRDDPFMLYGASQTRSFCYIEDAVVAMRLAIEHASAPAPTFHIGSQEETPISDLTDKLWEIMRWKPATIEHKSAPPGSVQRRLPDVQRIQAVTGWRATTPLGVGLRRTVKWYTGQST